MTTPDQIGARVRGARLDQGFGVKNAAAAAGLARDTWYRIEEGKAVQDAKRHAALKFLGLDSDGLPADESAYEPVTPETLDPRLNNIERQIDALWRRIDELSNNSPGGSVTPIRPSDTPPAPGTELGNEEVAEAARDRDVLGNPIRSRGRQIRREHDEAETGSQDPGGMDPA